MSLIEYVCRCGKRTGSLFQQKRHVKYECPMKHMPLDTSGKGIRIVGPAKPKAKP
jgi:hypothetical protein